MSAKLPAARGAQRRSALTEDARDVTRILVFYPSNKRSVQLETTILAMRGPGAEVELLTTCERGSLHAALAAEGVKTHAHPLPKRIAAVYYLRQVWHLVRFSRRRAAWA